MANDPVERRAGGAIALVLIDEHPLTRVGMRNILDAEEDIEVVAEAKDFEQALRFCRRHRPHVVLVDVDLPPAKIVESIRRLRAACADPAVVVLSHSDSDNNLFQATVAGAVGHLADQVEPAELTATIRRVARGDEPIREAIAERPEVGRRVLEALRDMSAVDTAAPLGRPSARQREILNHAANGLTNQQIGRTMGLSPSTVRAEISAVLRSFGLRHRTQAVVLAVRHGWISPPGPPPPS